MFRSSGRARGATPEWDAKVGLGALFVIGYFALIAYLVGQDDMDDNKKEIALIALAALGPQLGQIFGSIFRTTLADERTSERRSQDLRAAIVTPSAGGDTGEDVRQGARDGTREGIGDALGDGDPAR